MWFQENPQEWQDLREEFKVIQNNASVIALTPNNDNRAFYAGKCHGVQECIDLEQMRYQVKKEEKKNG